MYINNSSTPTIHNSRIVDNINGGGIYIGFSSPIFETCLIQGNNNQLGSGGGGVEIVNSHNLSFTSCIINDNETATEGGGVFCIQSSPQFAACTFSNNKANAPVYGTGGGLCAISNSQPEITDCIFSNNESTADGSGLAFDQSSPLIINCEVKQNTAGTTGGAIISRGSITTLKNCRILGNSSLSSGGAVSSYLNDELTLDNCVMSENSAALSGGGMYAHSNCNIKIYNCTLTANVAGEKGGGIWIDGTENDNVITLSNSIFWDNDAAINDEISVLNNSTPNITYSVIDESKVNFTVDLATNITGNTDPLLMHVANQDFHLTANSPCIDAGTDANAPITDFDDESRIDNPNFFNTDSSFVDIGADEFVDSDNDDLPDYWEVANGLNPSKSDADGDFLPDGWEVAHGFDPLIQAIDMDFDGDGLTDYQEYYIGSDPKHQDSNGNGILDSDEDLDLDGLTNLIEFQLGIDPTKIDSDDDRLADNWEVENDISLAAEYRFSPGNNDSDGDGISDDLEDYDNDGIINFIEYQNQTDPLEVSFTLTITSNHDGVSALGNPQGAGSYPIGTSASFSVTIPIIVIPDKKLYDSISADSGIIMMNKNENVNISWFASYKLNTL